jgi:hypothetical protein
VAVVVRVIGLAGFWVKMVWSVTASFCLCLSSVRAAALSVNDQDPAGFLDARPGIVETYPNAGAFSHVAPDGPLMIVVSGAMFWKVRGGRRRAHRPGPFGR